MKKTALLLLTLTTLLTTATAQPPHPILGGELSNSAVTSVGDIDEVIPRMKALGLNTVLVPAYWEFVEPREGVFDFTLTDRIVDRARENGLKVILLWFGAWKNSMSCYAPLWFKTDVKRFPRACTADGKPLEIASCFSENVFQADNRAFETLVAHTSTTASDVVTMYQVENEIGMLESARDHSRLADEYYKIGVPEALLTYLRSHRSRLHPWLAARLKTAHLVAKSPTWTELFGDDIFTDEIFMAYYYADYVGRLCRTARRHTTVPLYVNAAMNSRGRLPGQYPSAGPLAHLIDIWRAAAPELLLLAPDIYDTGFKGWAEQYALPGNPLFVPESRCCENSGARALYTFGEHRASGFSPFAIDQADDRSTATVTKAYDIVRQLYSLKNINTLKSWGVLFDQTDKERVIDDGSTLLTCRHYYTLPWDPRATDGSTWPEGGAMIVRLANDEFLVAGTGVVVSFATPYEKSFEEEKALGEDGFVADGSGTKTNNAAAGTTAGTAGSTADSTRRQKTFTGKRLGIGFVDEVRIDAQGDISFVRRDNGDQDHQGRHARIDCDSWKILHVKLYEY